MKVQFKSNMDNHILVYRNHNIIHNGQGISCSFSPALKTYAEKRIELLECISILNANGHSYKEFCDYINAKQTEFKLFKDFFSRFRSNNKYYNGPSKKEKLSTIVKLMQAYYELEIENKYPNQAELMILVSKALDAEFETYKMVNKVSLNLNSNLSAYFSNKDVAFKTIKRNIQQKIQYNWVLETENMGSTFALLKSKISSVFHDTAIINTEEHWKLCWTDKITGDLVYRFETINEQTYLVIKTKNGWRIKDNIYEATLNKKRPEVYSKQDIQKLSLTKPIHTSLQSIENNELGKAVDIILNSSLKIHNYREQLIGVKSSYLNILRELNIDRIEYPIYLKEVSKIKIRLLKIIETLKD